jgi:hypothetical protein
LLIKKTEKTEDTMNTLVKKAMSEKVFCSIISNTYFVEERITDPSDRFGKMRPLFVQLKKMAKKW